MCVEIKSVSLALLPWKTRKTAEAPRVGAEPSCPTALSRVQSRAAPAPDPTGQKTGKVIIRHQKDFPC